MPLYSLYFWPKAIIFLIHSFVSFSLAATSYKDANVCKAIMWPYLLFTFVPEAFFVEFIRAMQLNHEVYNELCMPLFVECSLLGLFTTSSVMAFNVHMIPEVARTRVNLCFWMKRGFQETYFLVALQGNLLLSWYTLRNPIWNIPMHAKLKWVGIL